MTPTEPQAAGVLCLVGPTAAGKSEVAHALAARYPIEIISVDSALVYRGMDIGTAKPSAREQREVMHHLIDLIDPNEGYSAARFCADARQAILEVRGRGHIPLLVGGTMLYFKALREGLDALPSANPVVRMSLEAEAAEKGWPALHSRLAEVDPETAARLKPADAQRIQRALEVWQISGRPLSSFFTAAASRTIPGESFVYVALEPQDRSMLHERIGRRFESMLERGLIEEVTRLRARGDLHPGLPSMRSVGYRQIWRYLEGQCDRAEMIESATAATRQLAKRQLTWLRALPERHSVDCFSANRVRTVETLVAKCLERAAREQG